MAFSELTNALIVDGVVLAAVLASDLGGARKIGWVRMARPLIAAVVIPFFMQRPIGHGNSLVVELAGVVAGVLGGLAATALMGVYRSPKTGAPVSRAGAAYAIFWTVIIGARAVFSYGTAHWFTASIVDWAIEHQVAEAAIVDGLIFMAVVMVLIRTFGLGLRAQRLPALTPAEVGN
jgi:hypothetical protein